MAERVNIWRCPYLISVFFEKRGVVPILYVFSINTRSLSLSDVRSDWKRGVVPIWRVIICVFFSKLAESVPIWRELSHFLYILANLSVEVIEKVLLSPYVALLLLFLRAFSRVKKLDFQSLSEKCIFQVVATRQSEKVSLGRCLTRFVKSRLKLGQFVRFCNCNRHIKRKHLACCWPARSTSLLSSIAGELPSRLTISSPMKQVFGCHWKHACCKRA